MIPRACMRCEASPGHAHAHARHQPFPHSVWARSLTDRPGNMEGKCSVKKRFFNEASPRNTVWPVSRHVAGPLGMGGIVEHGPLRSPIEPGVSLPRDRGCSPAERSLASRRLAGRSLASRRLAGCQAQSEAAGRSLASRRLAGCQAQSGVRAGKKNAALPGRGYSACWCAVPAARRGMPVYWAPARAVALGPSCVMEHSDLASGLFRGWRAELHGLGT
jgi:hypothetical protein